MREVESRAVYAAEHAAAQPQEHAGLLYAVDGMHPERILPRPAEFQALGCGLHGFYHGYAEKSGAGQHDDDIQPE